MKITAISLQMLCLFLCLNISEGVVFTKCLPKFRQVLGKERKKNPKELDLKNCFFNFEKGFCKSVVEK